MNKNDIEYMINYVNYHVLKGDMIAPYEIKVESLDSIPIELLDNIIDPSMVRFNFKNKSISYYQLKELIGYGVKTNNIDKNSIYYQIEQANYLFLKGNLLSPMVINVSDINDLNMELLDCVIAGDNVLFFINGYYYTVSDLKSYLSFDNRKL